jgi:hypothetical protein
VIPATPEEIDGPGSHEPPPESTKHSLTHGVVVRVGDQTVLSIHEHPVEAASSEDGLGDGRVREAEEA